MTIKQAIEKRDEALAEGTAPVALVRCKNCYGTGTVFVGRGLRVGNSRVCPVCRGKCKVPA